MKKCKWKSIKRRPGDEKDDEEVDDHLEEVDDHLV